MAGDEQKKERLIRFLEQRVWDPISRASPEGYSEADRKRLERVQRKTEAQRERYRGYESAGQVRQEFRDDLSSEPARKTNADLKKLGLPTQPDVADEFFELADRLGVEAERAARRPHEPHPPHPWHKSKPEEREKARRELMRRAREGDRDALDTLRNAPQKWVREYAEKIERERKGGGQSG